MLTPASYAQAQISLNWAGAAPPLNFDFVKLANGWQPQVLPCSTSLWLGGVYFGKNLEDPEVP